MNENIIRQKKGSALAEVSVGIVIIILVVFVFLDLYSVVSAFMLNDEIAKESARAASFALPDKLEICQDRPLGEDQAPYRSASTLIECRLANLPKQIELSPVLRVTETINPPIPVYPFGGRVHGTVTVQTTMQVHLMFIGRLLKFPAISLIASSTYPYTSSAEYSGKEF